ncbi:MAG: LptF/LptG family permease [Spirochaetes bacterium]|nr:LptF/LptG family permease [Spirochaetota bacterium]
MAAKRLPLVPIIVGFVLLGYGAALLFAVYEGTPARIIPRFLLSWRMLRAAIMLSSLIIPVLFAAAAASASFTVHEGGKSFDAVRPILAPALMLCVLFSSYRLIAVPPLVRALRTAETTSRHFKEAFRNAEDAFHNRDYPGAQEALAICRRIDSNDRAFSDLNDQVEAEIIKRSASANDARMPDAPPAASGIVPAENAEGWYARAREAEAKGDFHTALFFIDRALTMSPEEPAYRAERKKILDAVAALKPPPEDTVNGAIYARKIRGYQALRAGDPRTAYAIYLELSKTVPNDPDVVHYLKESLAELSKSVVFLDNAIRALGASPSGRFLVVRRESGVEYVLAAKRAVDSWDAVYFEDMELAVFENGQATTRVSSRYARLHGATALLRTVDRDAPDTVFEPRWTAGKPELSFAAEMPIDHETAARILSLRNGMDAVSFSTLWSGLDDVRRYGVDPLPYRKEMANRAVFPFAALMSVLLGVAFGARFRRREAPNALVTAFGMAVMTASAAFVFAGISWLGGGVVENLYDLLPAAGAFSVWIGASAVAVAGSLLAAGRALSHVRP